MPVLMPVPTPSTRRGRARARAWIRRLALDDRGMSTAEYAIGTVAAAGFAALLFVVLRGHGVTDALDAIIQRALSTTF